MIIELLAKLVYCVYLPDDEELDKILTHDPRPIHELRGKLWASKTWWYTVIVKSKCPPSFSSPPQKIASPSQYDKKNSSPRLLIKEILYLNTKK